MGKTLPHTGRGGESRKLEGFSSQVWPVAFSPDGRLAAAGGGQDVPQMAWSASGTSNPKRFESSIQVTGS